MDLATKALSRGGLLLSLSGRMDAIGTAAVESRLVTHAAGATGVVVVDLSGVSFIASAGVRSLLVTLRSAAARGGRALLACPPGEVRRVLILSGLPHVAPLLDSLEAALLEAGGEADPAPAAAPGT